MQLVAARSATVPLALRNDSGYTLDHLNTLVDSESAQRTKPEETMTSHMQYQELCEGGLDRIRDAEDFTRLSRSKLYALMKAGELPYVTIGRCRRIPHRALIDLVARNLGG